MAGKEIKTGARNAALKVLERVEAGAYADILLDSELKGLSAQDAALATELTYGVLRWKLRLDYTIDLFSAIRTGKLERKVLSALRLGAYQLLFLTKVPASAAINESVELVKPDRKRAGFVNAVLRKVLSEKERIALPEDGDPVRRVSVAWSHPEWMVRRWAERYGLEEAEEICRAGQAAPPKTIRVNTLLTTRERLADELGGEGFDARETLYSPCGLDVRGGGALGPNDPRYYIQDEASQLVPLLLAPRPGETVLDACSAPGGKTSHMAQLMDNRGVVYAVDRNASRLRAVAAAASRLGAGIIQAFKADSSAPFAFIKEGALDAVLCDAPCSGLGVLRRAPDSRYRRKEDDIEELAGIQARLLDNLSGYLKIGGRLVYSVCTFEPEETEGTVSGFLEKHGDFSIEDASVHLPPRCRELVDKNGFLRTFPHRHGMDGFFAVRLRRD